MKDRKDAILNLKKPRVLVYAILISLLHGILGRLDNSYRLPSSIRPLHYNLSIEPNFANLSDAYFNGSVTIRLGINVESDRITFHARNLTIDSSSIRINDRNGTERRIANFSVDNARDFYTIQLFEPLLGDQLVDLNIGHFSGNLNFDNVGFYLAKYKDKAKNERVLALTDFQPIGARKAFPCFDEPSFKSTFLVSIVRQKGYISVSNEELISTVDLGGGRFQDNYKETVNMSTYIVAFSVSDYSRTIQRGPIAIYAPTDIIQSGQVDFAQFVANDMLRVFENYTAVKYPMKKLDMFTVPSEYFESGGMENWGLITFSEHYLVCTNDSTIGEIRRCTMMIGHEIAHQWFGNLVTPQSWNFLWLSEGFSTYMEYYVTSLVNPSWSMMDQFVVYILQPLLKADMKGLHYLNYESPYPGIMPPEYTAYYKGAAIVRMLEHVLTRDTFHLGIRMYLKKFAYASVTAVDLYVAFQSAVDCHNKSSIIENLTVSQIMSTWDTFPGYPLVNVSRNSNGTISLSQKPFSYSSIYNIWYIPINFITENSSSTTPQMWLKEKSMVVQADIPSDWILINNQQTGYYRTNYDFENWRSISCLLNGPKFNTIHVSSRAQLIDDAFVLASHNYIPYDIPLNLSLYLRREMEFSPFFAFFENIEMIELYLAHLGKEKMFARYVKDLLQHLYYSIGFAERSSDTYLDRYNRINLMMWSCNLNLFDCRNYSLATWTSWLVNGTEISTDLEVAILCGAMQAASAKEWELLHLRYELADKGSRKSKLFMGLGCTGDRKSLEKFLDLTFNNSAGISARDRKAALTRVVQIDRARVDAVFEYLIRHVQANDIYQELRVADVLCRRVIRDQQFQVLNLLKLSLPNSPLISLCYQQARRNLAWLQQDNLQVINDWFEVYDRNVEKYSMDL